MYNMARKKFNAPDYWTSVGFIVGESHIHHADMTPCIRVAQVERQPLVLLEDLYGGRIYGPYKYSTNQSPYYYWGVSGKNAIGTIMTLLSGLQKISERKYQQGVNTIAKWKTFNWGKSKYAKTL